MRTESFVTKTNNELFDFELFRVERTSASSYIKPFLNRVICLIVFLKSWKVLHGMELTQKKFYGVLRAFYWFCTYICRTYLWNYVSALDGILIKLLEQCETWNNISIACIVVDCRIKWKQKRFFLIQKKKKQFSQW